MDVTDLVFAVVSRRRAGRLATALGAALLATCTGAAACGLEDPASIPMRRGALNLAFPESLRVGTAVWQAALDGTLPRDPLAQRDDLTPEVRAGMRQMRTNTVLRRFSAQIAAQAAAPGGAAPPDMAMVLLGPVMWTRFEAGDGTVTPLLHVEGPEPGDVVLVTDLAAVDAITRGSLTLAAALDLGFLRLYGSPAGVAAARDWMIARG